VGPLALLAALGAAVSGTFLAFHFAPTLRDAHSSLLHLTEEVLLGGFLRGLHHWAAQAALVLALLHGARLFWRGAHRSPPRALWVTGVAIALTLLALAWTGYLSAGDERAVAGMEVLGGVAGSTPLVGPALRRLALGGDAVSSATLVRLHALHAQVLPLLLLALVLLYLRLKRLRGDLLPAIDAPRGGALLAAVALAALLWPPALGAAPDPAGEPSPDAKPEWFFLWVNYLLERAPGGTFLLGGLLPLLLASALLLLPWIARVPRHPLAERVVAATVASLLLALTLAAAESAGRRGSETPEPALPDVSLDERAREVMRSFRCANCHVIDGNPSVDESGPPLDRAGFPELYTKEFFRRKVGDPRAFWPDTNMLYTPKSKKPTPGELEILVRWFFGDR
jgi:quinol-cytochrome oxidoreductase complex cytochrome b subunit